MYIYANTDRLEDLLPMLHEQRRQAKQLVETCNRYYAVAWKNQMEDAHFYRKQAWFWEEQESRIIRRISLLERTVEKLRRQTDKAEDHLMEALVQMQGRSGMYL